MNIDGTLLGFVVDGIMSGDPLRIASIAIPFIMLGLFAALIWGMVVGARAYDSPRYSGGRMNITALTENAKAIDSIILNDRDAHNNYYKVHWYSPAVDPKPRKCSRKRKQ